MKASELAVLCRTRQFFENAKKQNTLFYLFKNQWPTYKQAQCIKCWIPISHCRLDFMYEAGSEEITKRNLKTKIVLNCPLRHICKMPEQPLSKNMFFFMMPEYEITWYWRTDYWSVNNLQLSFAFFNKSSSSSSMRRRRRKRRKMRIRRRRKRRRRRLYELLAWLSRSNRGIHIHVYSTYNIAFWVISVLVQLTYVAVLTL